MAFVGGATTKCLLDAKWLAEVLSDFKAVSDEGVYTSQRHLEPGWGFYPSLCRPTEPLYADLLMMDPLAAYALAKRGCFKHITTARLWCSDHHNAALFRSNTPEQYDLNRREWKTVTSVG